MIYMIDSISKRYGMLPSQMMSSATTFDLFIMDAAINIENYLQEQAEKDAKGGKKIGANYDVNELQKMLDGVKNNDNKV